MSTLNKPFLRSSKTSIMLQPKSPSMEQPSDETLPVSSADILVSQQTSNGGEEINHDSPNHSSSVSNQNVIQTAESMANYEKLLVESGSDSDSETDDLDKLNSNDMLKMILSSMKRMDNNIFALRSELTSQLNEVKAKTHRDILLVRQDVDNIKEQEIKTLKEVNTTQWSIIKKLSDKINTLETTLETKLTKADEKIHDMEIELYSNSQQTRRVNLEIQGIPNNVDNDDLKACSVEVLKSTGVHVKARDIEIAHRLPPKRNSTEKPVIVRFKNRTLCEEIIKNKRKLANFGPEEGSLLPTKAYYLKNNNCKYFNSLEYYCRKLKRGGKITGFQSAEGSLRVSLGINASKRIYHFDDLERLFPDFAFEDQEDD